MARFHIPERDEDLLLPDPELFHLSRIPPIGSAVEALYEFPQRMKSEGWYAVSEFFEYFFAIARKGSDLEECDQISVRLKLLDILLKAFRAQLDDLGSQLPLACETHISDQVVEESQSHVDILLMQFYLFWRLNSFLENEYVKRQKNIAPEKGKKKGKMAELGGDDELSEWPKYRAELLEYMLEFLDAEAVNKTGKRCKPAIKFLWRPTVVDPGLLKTVTRIIFDWLDSPDNRLKSNGWLVQVFRLFVPLCVSFHRHTVLGALLLEKTLQLEYARDSYPFIEAIQRQTRKAHQPETTGDVSERQNALDGLLNGMLAHVVNLNTGDLNTVNSSSTSRPLCNFIQTMSSRAPHLMMKQISSLMRFLREDPWQLRSAVLQAMGDIICSEEMNHDRLLNSHTKEARDNMLRILQEHLKDASTQVRAKVITLWKMIAESERLKGYETQLVDNGILDDMAARLEDKLVSVRKPAIQFMTAFLKKNPFGHDFTFNMNVEALRDAIKQRDDLRRNNPENSAQTEAFRNFRAVLPTLKAKLVAAFDAAGRGEVFDLGMDFDVEEMFDGLSTAVVRDPGIVARTICALAVAGKLPGIDINEQEKTEVIEELLRRVETKYVMDTVNALMNDDQWKLRNEEKISDYRLHLAVKEANIDYLRSKLHTEMSMAETLQSALRGALQGDTSELKEAISFIIQCKNFMIRGSDEVVRAVFSLIWRNNKDYHKEVLAAAREMLISQNTNKEVANASTAENMMNTLKGTNESDYASVQEVIVRLLTHTDYKLPKGVIDYTLELIQKDSITSKGKETTRISRETKLLAMQLLGILTKAEPEYMRSRMRQFQQMVVWKDRDFATEAVEIIWSMGTERTKDDRGEKITPVVARQRCLKLDVKDSLFDSVQIHFLKEFLSTDCQNFSVVCRRCLNLMFDLCREPSKVLSRCVAEVLWHLGRAATSLSFYEAEGAKAEKDGKTNTERGATVISRRAYWRENFDKLLERSLYFAGEVATKIFVYVDTVVVKEMKRLQEVANATGRGEQGLAMDEIKCRPFEQWEVDSAMREGLFLYMEAGSAGKRRAEMNHDTDCQDDNYSDMSQLELKNQLMNHQSLLARLLPLINFCVQAQGTHRTTRVVAATAFAKIVPLCQQYASNAAFLLMMLMSASSDPQIRENMLVSMPDMYQFVSLPFDKYQGELFNMCRDVNPAVRETAILVLLYVTTNAIVESRSGIADVARCYVDPSEDIQTVTRNFFAKMAETGKSVIYNAMPDFLSRLSRNPKHITLEDFRKIMTYLFDFLEDLEIDDLCPRILQRLGAVDASSLQRNPDLPVYLMFCLYYLARTEKAFYKIRDLIRVVEPHLHMRGVYDYLCMTIEKMRKVPHSHPGFVDELNAFMNDLNQKHADKVQHHRTLQQASQYQRRQKMVRKARAGRRRALNSSDESDASMEDIQEEE